MGDRWWMLSGCRSSTSCVPVTAKPPAAAVRYAIGKPCRARTPALTARSPERAQHALAPFSSSVKGDIVWECASPHRAASACRSLISSQPGTGTRLRTVSCSGKLKSAKPSSLRELVRSAGCPHSVHGKHATIPSGCATMAVGSPAPNARAMHVRHHAADVAQRLRLAAVLGPLAIMHVPVTAGGAHVFNQPEAAQSTRKFGRCWRSKQLTDLPRLQLCTDPAQILVKTHQTMRC